MNVTAPLDDLIRTWPASPHNLLQVLRDVQAHFGHVPPQAIDALVQQWGLSYTAVRSVVSFYHFLSFEPRGRYTVYVSDSVTDRMLGNESLIARLCQRLGVAEGVTSADGRVSVHRTACTGLCDQGPAGLVNGRPLVQLTPRRIDEIADLILSDTPLDAWPADFFAVHNPVWRHSLTLSHPIAPGTGLQAMLSRGAEAPRACCTPCKPPACAAVAVPALPPGKNGMPAATPPARAPSPAMPTRANPAPSKTACC